MLVSLLLQALRSEDRHIPASRLLRYVSTDCIIGDVGPKLHSNKKEWVSEQGS